MSSSWLVLLLLQMTIFALQRRNSERFSSSPDTADCGWRSRHIRVILFRCNVKGSQHPTFTRRRYTNSDEGRQSANKSSRKQEKKSIVGSDADEGATEEGGVVHLNASPSATKKKQKTGDKNDKSKKSKDKKGTMTV